MAACTCLGALGLFAERALPCTVICMEAPVITSFTAVGAALALYSASSFLFFSHTFPFTAQRSRQHARHRRRCVTESSALADWLAPCILTRDAGVSGNIRAFGDGAMHYTIFPRLMMDDASQPTCDRSRDSTNRMVEGLILLHSSLPLRTKGAGAEAVLASPPFASLAGVRIPQARRA